MVFIPLIITKSVFPKFIDGQISKRNYLILPLIPCVSICLFILFTGDILLDFLYGSAFNQAKTVLRFQILSLIIVSVGTSYSKIIISHNLQKYSLFVTVLGAFLQILF